MSTANVEWGGFSQGIACTVPQTWYVKISMQNLCLQGTSPKNLPCIQLYNGVPGDGGVPNPNYLWDWSQNPPPNQMTSWEFIAVPIGPLPPAGPSFYLWSSYIPSGGQSYSAYMNPQIFAMSGPPSQPKWVGRLTDDNGTPTVQITIEMSQNQIVDPEPG